MNMTGRNKGALSFQKSEVVTTGGDRVKLSCNDYGDGERLLPRSALNFSDNWTLRMYHRPSQLRCSLPGPSSAANCFSSHAKRAL